MQDSALAAGMAEKQERLDGFTKWVEAYGVDRMWDLMDRAIRIMSVSTPMGEQEYSCEAKAGAIATCYEIRDVLGGETPE